MNRAYSLFEIKSIDDEQRIVEGFTSTPAADRGGDVLAPAGASFSLPMPLLWQHKQDEPIGEVFDAKVTSDGIWIKARIAKDVAPYIDRAWTLIKARLVRGFSVGWKPLTPPAIKGDIFTYAKWAWIETSAVTIPMNAEASIALIKSIDAPTLAASGLAGDERVHVNTPGVSGTPVVRLLPTRLEHRMKSIADDLTTYKSTRDQKFSERDAIMTKASDEGRTLDDAESQQYDDLDTQIKGLDKHLERLEAMQTSQKSMAVPANGRTSDEGNASRGGQSVHSVRVQPNEPKGIGFARAALCKMASYLSMGTHSPLDIAKARYPDNDRLHTFLKATIPAGTTTHVTWAAPLVDTTNLVGDFIEFQRPLSLLGRIQGLRRVPFNVRVPKQTSGGDAYWVGEGAAKPVTKFDYGSVSLGHHKVASIAVITEELARFSQPNAEVLVRDALAAAVNERIDIDFIDPSVAAVAGVSPASITNGLTALSPSGTSADAARADVARMIMAYRAANNRASSLVLLMPDALALFLSVMRNSLGQREFPELTMNGGNLDGIPVITSQYLANSSGAGNLVVAINAGDILLADDGNVTVDVSREASIQMLDNPTNSSATGTAVSLVSLWQTNSIGLRAEREITWAKAKAEAVVYMDDVNWGSVGSP